MKRMLLIAALFVVYALSSAYAQVDSQERISLLIQEEQGAERKGEIVSGGIPFPQGKVYDPADIQVYDPNGQPVLTQAHQLGLSWPDGSLRWALVQFPAHVEASASVQYALSTAGAVLIENQPVVRFDQMAQGIVVDTGALRFTLDRQGGREGRTSFLPNAVVPAGDGQETGWLADRPGVRYIADREHLTPEMFKQRNVHANTLWSFGLGGVQGEEYGQTLYNRYAANVALQAANTVRWHDWSDVIQRDIDYSGLFAGPMELEVEEAGPVRAVIHFRTARAPQEGDIGYSGRLYAYAGSPLLRIELTVENYEESPVVPREEDLPHDLHIANTKHVRAFSLHFKPAFKPQVVRYGLDETHVEVVGDRSSRLHHQSEDSYTLYDGQLEHSTGKQAPGWIAVTDGTRQLSLGTKYFHEIYPKSLRYDADQREIVLELWPADAPEPGYPFTAGRVRTYEFVLGFDVDGPVASAAARGQLRPYPDPEYMASTDAAPRFVPLTDQQSFPVLAEFIDNSYQRFMKHHLLYGDIHFGDRLGWSRLSTASGYHGVAREFFIWYYSSGDPAHFRIAEAAAWHNLDIDQFHWGQRAGEHVKQHTRSRDHFTPRQMGGIAVWNFGDVDYYFLTGNRRVLPSLERTADRLLQAGGFRSGDFHPSRATTLPLKHLLYMYEAIGDEQAMEDLFPGSFPEDYPHRRDSVATEKARAYLVRAAEAAQYLAGVYEQGRYRKVPFMASYATEGLYRFWRLTGDQVARRAVQQSADFLYQEMIIPTGVNYYSGDVSTHLQATSYVDWSPWYDEVDLPAARAAEAAGDSRYLEYAKAALDWRLNYHVINSNHYGFSSTIPTTLWYLRQAGLTQADLSQLRPDLDYDQALEKTRQRALAWLEDASPGEARTGLQLALEVARVLISLGRTDEAVQWLELWQQHRESPRDQEQIARFLKRAHQVAQAAAARPGEP